MFAPGMSLWRILRLLPRTFNGSHIRAANVEIVKRVNIGGGLVAKGSKKLTGFAIAGEDISMLTGREETLLSCLLMGANGCMTATAGIFPEIMVGIYRSWKEGDLETALKLQKLILVVIRTMFAAPFPIGFKLAMEMRGIKMGPPLIPPSAADTYQISTVKSRLKMLMEPLLAELGEEVVA